jgi:2-polyprenyl-3-methyl-5-hydroxy-6-metoxy-1,4-benzoquinol methylase
MAHGAPHKYEYSIDLASDSAGARVIAMVGKGKRVLEVGAGPGSITRHLIDHGQCDVVAVEIDPDAVERLRSFCPQVHSADLNDPQWHRCLAGLPKFDAVVAADVLEHLTDPWRALKDLRNLLNEEGFVVLSLPHVGHLSIVACLMEQNFEYRDWGLLDRTHLRFFGLKNMEALIADAGLKIIDAGFVIKAPESTEYAWQWQQLPISTRKILHAEKFGHVYQVVTKSVPAERSSSTIQLMDLPVEIPPLQVPPWERWHRRVLRKYLDPRTRSILRRAARMLGLAA